MVSADRLRRWKMCERKKRAFKRQVEAARFARSFPGRSREYLCPYCGLWHITSTPKKKGKD